MFLAQGDEGCWGKTMQLFSHPVVPFAEKCASARRAAAEPEGAARRRVYGGPGERRHPGEWGRPGLQARQVQGLARPALRDSARLLQDGELSRVRASFCTRSASRVANGGATSGESGDSIEPSAGGMRPGPTLDRRGFVRCDIVVPLIL